MSMKTGCDLVYPADVVGRPEIGSEELLQF
jgi:hypothetical protein